MDAKMKYSPNDFNRYRCLFFFCRASEKALLVETPDKVKVWLPLSQVDVVDFSEGCSGGRVTRGAYRTIPDVEAPIWLNVPRWLLEKHGLSIKDQDRVFDDGHTQQEWAEVGEVPPEIDGWDGF